MKLSRLLQGVYYGRYEKLVHFFVAFVLYFIILFLSSYWMTAVYWVIIISVGKELYDKFVRKTEFSLTDLAADAGGMITALIISKFF
jgi:hypothetical protein